MAVIASWKTKSWEVSTNKIYNFQNLSTSYQLKTNENEEKDGTAPTNVRGRELVPLSFDVFMSDVAGIDVRSEIESWDTLVGESAPFYLGGKRFGPPLMKLQKVTLRNSNIDDLGRFRSAEIALEFKENADEATKLTLVATGTSAMSVGASSLDKQSMKSANQQLANSSSTGIAAGSKIKIVGSNYATGENVPQWVKSSTQVVTKISGAKALIGGNGGINSWVYVKDLSLT